MSFEICTFGLMEAGDGAGKGGGTLIAFAFQAR